MHRAESVDLKWTREPQDQRVSVGSAVEIPCESNSPSRDTKVQWFRVDEDGSNHQLVNYDSGTLRLAPVSLDHGGYYECQISDGSTSKLVRRVKLDVLGK